LVRAAAVEPEGKLLGIAVEVRLTDPRWVPRIQRLSSEQAG
jgi:hypothetical protein